MASARTALAVLAALGVAALGAPRQKGNPYFHTCRYRGRHWDECVRTVTQDLRPLFVSGIPELGVRPIDPLFVDTFNVSEVSRKFRVNLQITNVSMHGLRDYTVTGVRSNLQELSLEIRLRVPNLSFRANYYMDGRFLFLALSGGGTCRYNLTDVDNNIVVNGHLVRRVSDDALHFRAATLRWTMMPSTGSSRFTSEGDASVYSHATSRLLNEHGVAALFQRAAERAFGEVLRERVNRLLMNIPYRDLFPPGVLPLHLLQRPMADSEVDEYPPLSWTRPATTTTTTTSTTTTTTTTTTSTTTLTPEIFITTTAPIKISPAEMPSRIDSPVGSVESHESGEWLGSDIPGRPEVPDTAVVIFKATDVSPDDDAETSTRGSSPEAISFGLEPQESTEVPTEISPLRPQAEDNPGVTANHQPVLATISDPDERSRRVNNSTTILNEGDVITVTSLDKHGVDPHDSQVQKVEPEAAVTELAATLELRPALPVQAHTATSLLGIPASPEVASQRLAIAPNLPAPAAAAPELVRSPGLATLLEHSPPSALSDSPLSPEPGAPGVDYYDESDAGKTNDRIATFDTAFTLEGGSGVNTTSLPTVLQDQPAALAESTLDKALSTSVPSRPSAAVGNVYTDKTPVFIATTESLGQPVAVAENVFIVRETASTSGSLEHPAVVAENVYIEDKIPDRRSEYTVVSAEKTSDAEAGISTSRTPTSAFQHGDDETAAVPAGSASLPDLSDVGGPGVSGGHNAIPLDGDEEDPSYNETESSAETPVSGILVKGQSRPRSHVSDDNDDTTAADGETNMTLRTDVFSLGTLDEAVGEVARGLMDVLAMATEEPVAR